MRKGESVTVDPQAVDDAGIGTERQEERDKMPKSNEAILSSQYNKLDRVKTRAARDRQAIARYNSRADRFRSGTGHGIAVLSPESGTYTYSNTGATATARLPRAEDFDAQSARLAKEIEAAGQESKDARNRRKTARKEMIDARNQHIASRMAQGKAHGVVVYSTRSKPVVGEVEVPSRHGSYNRYPVDEDGRVPVSEVRRIVRQEMREAGYTPRSAGTDGSRTARTVYPSRPTPQMMDDYLARPNRSDMVGVDAPKGTRPTVDARTYKKPKAATKSGSCKTKTKSAPKSGSCKTKTSKPKPKTSGRR